jgi:hypothetical protein
VNLSGMTTVLLTLHFIANALSRTVSHPKKEFA